MGRIYWRPSHLSHAIQIRHKNNLARVRRGKGLISLRDLEAEMKTYRRTSDMIKFLVPCLIGLGLVHPCIAQLDCTYRVTPEVVRCRESCPSIARPGGIRLSECLSGCSQLGKTCESWPSDAKDITIPYDVFQGILGLALAGSRIQISNMQHGLAQDIE